MDTNSIIHAHWDCSLGVTTKGMLTACLYAIQKESMLLERLDQDLVSLLGQYYHPNDIITQYCHWNHFSSNKERIEIIQTNDLYDILHRTSNHSGTHVRLLPSILATWQDAELSVTDYTVEFPIPYRIVLELVSILIVLDYIHVQTTSCSALPLEDGYMIRRRDNDDGNDPIIIPLPTPATLQLFLGMRISPSPSRSRTKTTTTSLSKYENEELVTSSACSLLRHLVLPSNGQQQSNLPNNFIPNQVLVGCNTRDIQSKDINQVRLLLGTIQHQSPIETLIPTTTTTTTSPIQQQIQPQPYDWNIDTLDVLEANIDDSTPESLAFLIEQLMTQGALDAWITPIVMKKGRSAHTVHCLCHAAATTATATSSSLSSSLSSSFHTRTTSNDLLPILFRYTLGVRCHFNIPRASLSRSFHTVSLPYYYYDANDNTKDTTTMVTPQQQLQQAQIDIKVGSMVDTICMVKPEFDHCRTVSLATGIPLTIIRDAAMCKFYQDHPDMLPKAMKLPPEK